MACFWWYHSSLTSTGEFRVCDLCSQRHFCDGTTDSWREPAHRDCKSGAAGFERHWSGRKPRDAIELTLFTFFINFFDCGYEAPIPALQPRDCDALGLGRHRFRLDRFCQKKNRRAANLSAHPKRHSRTSPLQRALAGSDFLLKQLTAYCFLTLTLLSHHLEFRWADLFGNVDGYRSGRSITSNPPTSANNSMLQLWDSH